MAQGGTTDAAGTEAESGGPEQRRQLVRDHLDLVTAAARAYPRSPLGLDELERHGNVGLLHAADEFDPARHDSFVDHATDHIVAAMDAAVDRHGTGRGLAEVIVLADQRTERAAAKQRHPTARRPALA